jgi:GH25 family lysozyme M1 (1,4-beta-N-acetylmuramidase)
MTRREKWLLATVAALAAALLALGVTQLTTGTKTIVEHTPETQLPSGPNSCVPREGEGVPGVCTPLPKNLAPPNPQTPKVVPKSGANTRSTTSTPAAFVNVAAVASGYVPDVSYFQGHPAWGQAKSHINGAIARVADGHFNDPAFAYNWHELRRLHIWHAAYFFVRPGNCTAEADRAVALVNAQGGFDSGPLIADAEVPLNYGCAAAFVREAKVRTGLPEVIYTAPGTWAGGPHGNALLWVASYGPHPGCVWTCAHVAWQFTDGLIGPYPHCTPGIGCDDISTDNGITKLGHKAEPSAAQKRVAKRRSLASHRATIVTLHKLIDKHHCRRGQHATPRSYHTVCGRWLRNGNTAHAVVRRLERELA